MSQNHVIIGYSSSIEIRPLKDITKVILSRSMHTTTGKRRPSLCLHPMGIAAFNGEEVGQVTLCDLRGDEPKTASFKQHVNPVISIAISPDGTMVASSSEKGTVMKLYKTPLFQNSSSFEFLHEIRRGSKETDVYSIAFTPDSKYVSLISSTRTVHIFYTVRCYIKTEYNGKTLGVNANHYVNITFLDNETVCLLYHEDGSLRTSHINSLDTLNTNSVSVLGSY